MLSGMQRLDYTQALPLFNVNRLRALEAELAASLPPHSLMQRAGLAVAQLAMAIAPHARCIWVACGPGNNGGDGLEAALHLHHSGAQWGKSVVVTWLGDEHNMPADARASLARARQAGVVFSSSPPDNTDLCIDALLGIGGTRIPEGTMGDWLALMAQCRAPVLCVDLPSGLCADTGRNSSILIANNSIGLCQKQVFTLTFLGLKPGMFTHQGRDACGEVWCDDLGATRLHGDRSPSAWLAGPPASQAVLHTSHKGSFGDVLVVGGDVSMAGAAILAADAALHGGAGRVYVSLLDPNADQLDRARPALMFRHWAELDLSQLTLVCGCGGGKAIRAVLPRAIAQTAHLVLDADALNHIAADAGLQDMLKARGLAGHATVLTPHPLEAARLLGISTEAVQSDRLGVAQRLADKLACTLVLKGSGTIIASPGCIPVINPTGNARLATAGTGDVLAGLIGARLAQGRSPHDSAMAAVWQHGWAADQWPVGTALTADQLARALTR